MRSVRPRGTVVAIAVLLWLVLAGVPAVAHAADGSSANPQCLACHGPSAPAGLPTADFAVGPVDRASACNKCHWITGHPYHYVSTQCGGCHTEWFAPLRVSFFRSAIGTPYGYFTTAASAEASADVLHAIHTKRSWPAEVANARSACAPCHAAASCEACHQGGVSHGSHGVGGDPSVGSPTQPVVVQVASGVTSEQMGSNVSVPLTPSACAASACHRGPEAHARIDDTSPSITYTGDWVTVVDDTLEGGSIAYDVSVEGGASFELTIEGDGFAWFGRRDAAGGIADVYVDGVRVATVDTYLSKTNLRKYGEVLYWRTNLGPGPHTVRVVNTGTKNPSSSGTRISLQYIDVRTSSAAFEPQPACTNCHATLEEHYGPDRHVSSWTLEGCIASGCHTSRDLSVEHRERVPGSDCALCHGNTSDPRYAQAIAAGDTACGACHTVSATDAHRSVHWADPLLIDATGPRYGYYTGSASTAPTGDCAMCHSSNLVDEHLGANGAPYLSRQPRYASDGTPLSCDSCHASSSWRVVDAIATGKTNCEACHDVHGPISATHRSAYVPGGDATCGTCHSAQLDIVHEGLSTTTASGKTLTGCSLCHDYYEGDRGAEVQNAIDVANDTNCTACHTVHGDIAEIHTAPDSQACVDCHETADVRELHGTSPQASCAICHNAQITLPNSTACANCHTTEGTDYHRAIPAAHTYADMPSYCTDAGCHAANTLPEAHEPYLSRYPQYASTCALCHRNSDPSRIDWSSASAACSSCHTVHGDIGQIHTAPDSQACVDCHETADVRELHGTGPQASCAVCHNAQIALPSSTACVNCHGALLPVDPNHYPAAAHDATAESGCGQCHYKDMKAEHSKPTVSVSCVQCHETRVDAFTGAWDKTCAACHPTKHGERQAKHVSPTTTCGGTQCHDISNVEAIHAGLSGGGCQACHRSPAEPATTTDCTASGCHTGVGPNHHEAHDASAANPSGCKGCHFIYLDDEHAALGYTCATCHASTNTIVTSAIASGDRRCLTCHPDSPHNARQAYEFTPKTSSGHRVATDLPGMQSSFNVNGVTYTWTLPTASSFLKTGWATDSIMGCDACHTYNAASGPHGSAMKVNIDPAYPTSWKSVYLTNTSNGMSSTSVICAKCHDLNGPSGTWSNKVHAEGDHHSSTRGKCVLCHAQVPHGWKRPRMIAYVTDPAPYAAASGGVQAMSLKSRTPTTWSEGDCQASCAGDHSRSVSPAWPLVLDPTAPTTGGVTGTVTHATTGAAVAGASVSIAGKIATTASDGTYTITGVAGGTYTMTVAAAGYTTWSGSVTITNGTNVTVNVALSPSSTGGGGTNLALGKTFTASRYVSSTYAPAKAGDGDTATYWWSKRDGGASDTEWLTVDLASSFSVRTVEIAWYGDYWAKEFRVHVSTDNRNWTQVYSTSSAAKGTSTITFSARNARYVKVECRRTGTGRNNGYGIAELRVFQ